MADSNYQSYWGEVGLRISGQHIPPLPIDPKAYSDILKFSVCKNTIVSGCTILGGSENCTDAVRGEDYVWTGCHFHTMGGKGVFTIKGSISRWVIDRCLFVGHGKEYDIELGQYDDYWHPFRKPTRNGSIVDCGSSDGRPIKVTVWNADAPTVVNSHVQIVKIPWVVWFPYFCFRKIQSKIKSFL